MNPEAEIKDRLTSLLNDLFGFFDMVPTLSTVVEDNILMVEIKTERDDLFVGRSSTPLLALQHIVRLVIRNEFPDSPYSVSLNIASFHQQQRERLSRIAQDAAAQVRSTGMAVHLPPMSSFERRLVHVALSEERDVVSESTGFGQDRRVVVKPVAKS